LKEKGVPLPLMGSMRSAPTTPSEEWSYVGSGGEGLVSHGGEGFVGGGCVGYCDGGPCFWRG